MIEEQDSGHESRIKKTRYKKDIKKLRISILNGLRVEVVRA